MGTVTKLVDRATPTDLAEYLVQHAPDSRARSIPRGPLTRGFKRLLEAYDQDRFLLVAVVDHLLDHGWPTQSEGVSERMLTVGVFDYALRELGGSRQPWRYLYYRRFRESREERDYFTFWLGRLEDTRQALPGTDPGLGGKDWASLREEAAEALDVAVTTIQQRLTQRGYLVEWPPLPDDPRPSAEGLDEFLSSSNRPSPKTRRSHGTSSS